MTAAILATILFALSAVSGKRLSHHLTAVEANVTRFFIAAVFLGIYSHVFGAGLGGGVLGMFFISGIVGFGLGDYGLFQAYRIIGSRLAMVMTQCLAAPFAATVEWLWLGSAHRRSGVGRDRYSNWRWPGIGPGDPGQIDKAHWKVGIFWG